MTRTATTTKPTPWQPDPRTLRRVGVMGGESHIEYYADLRGSLYYKSKGGGYVWERGAGKWTEVAAPVDKPAPDPASTALAQRLTPDPAPAEIPPARRFSFSFTAEVDGVQGTLTIEASMMRDVITTLTEVRKTAATRPGAAIKLVPTKPEDEFFVMLADGTAFCRKHGEAMRLREKQGDSWWSHDTGGECWCRGRPGKDSPGWDK